MPRFLNSIKQHMTGDAGKIAGGAVAGGAIGGLAGYGGAHFFGDPNHPGYNIAGHNFSQEQLFAGGGAMIGMLAGGGGAAFFTNLQNKKKKDYIILLDKSSSMGGGRLDEAKAAIMQIAPHVCTVDPDGVTLIVFADSAQRYGNIRDANQLMGLLNGLQPQGNSNLASALQCAFQECGRGKGASVLVMTAGLPSTRNETVDVLRGAANQWNPEMLKVTFIQIGDDQNGTAYLKWLDNDLKAKYDICDTIKDEDMKRAGLL